MKAGWKEVKLGDIITLKNGYSFKSDTYEADGDYNIVTIKNVTGARYINTDNCSTISQLPDNIKQHQQLKIGDILISMTGNVGRVSMVNSDDCLLNQRVGLIEVKPNVKIDREFLFQLLNSKSFEAGMIERGHGAAQLNIGKNDIESYTICIPESLDEQARIAKILRDLGKLSNTHQSKVEILTRMKSQLMSNKTGIIERECKRSEQLQDIDHKIIDITSRLPKQFRADNLERTQKIINIFTYVGEDDLNGNAERERERAELLPEITWKTAKLGDLCSIKTGKLPAKAAVDDGEYTFFTANTSKDCMTDTYSYDTEAVLMSKDGEYAGFVRYYNGKFNVSNHSFVITNFNGVTAKYVKYYLQNIYDQIRILASGGAIPGISMAVLSSLEIRYPESLEHQKLVAKILADLDSLANLHKSKADILSKMKSQLMSNKTGIIEQERQKSEVPAGWIKVRLGDILECQYGKFNKNPDNGGEYPIYGANGIIGGFDQYNAENSIVIGHIGQPGSVNFVRGKHFVTYNGIITKPKKNVDIVFLYYLLIALNLPNIAKGSSQKYISYDILYNIDVYIPSSIQEQQRIAKILESYDGLIESQSQLIQIVERERAVTEAIAHRLIATLATGEE